MIRWGSSKQTDESLKENAAGVLRNCQKQRDGAMGSYRVKTLMDALLEAGCPLPPRRIYCAVCKDPAMGAYYPREHKIMLCQNNIWTAAQFERTLAHELVHAYDYCRAYMNFKNIHHQACTEIRAAALSGDCDLTAEFARGVYQWKNHHRVCVRRRAIKSVAAHPECPSDAEATKAVDHVFETCYSDISPFSYLW